MRRRILALCVVGLLAALLGVLGWTLAPARVAVQDVNQPETLVLEDKRKGNTYAYSISGSGELDGEATFTLLLGEEPYRVERVSGRFAFRWGGDWYSDTARVRYEPINVKSGKAVLRYTVDKL